MDLAYPKISLRYKTLCLIVASLYAALLCLFPMEGVLDRVNYLEMARVSPLIIARFLGQGLHSLFANEPVWLGINAVLGLLLEDVVVVRIIIFSSAALLSYVLLVNNPRNFLLVAIILIFPQVMKNYVIHLRQGVAIACFMAGWLSQRKRNKWFFLGLSPLIHSSFFIILAIVIGSWVLRKLRIAPDLKLLIFGAGSLAVALFAVQLSAAIGARQAETTMVMRESTSGVGFLFWSTILLLMLFQGRQFLHQHTVALGVLIFYLAAYFFTPIAGRVFESGIVLVLLALLATTGWRRLLALSILLAFNAALMVVTYTQPLMGFAVD